MPNSRKSHQSYVQNLLVLCSSLHKVHASYLCKVTDQITSLDFHLSDKSTVSDFVLEKIEFLYKSMTTLVVKTKPYIWPPIIEVLDYFHDDILDDYTFCPAKTLGIDRNSANFQIKVTIQLILWSYISPFCKDIVLDVLTNVAKGAEANSDTGVSQEKMIWDWLLAFLKCVTSTVRTVVISKNVDSIWGFMLVPYAIRCSLKPLSDLTDTKSQSSFTHALLEYLLVKQDTPTLLPAVLKENDAGWINVDLIIPSELRADVFFQQWNHDSSASAETSLSLNQASVANTQSSNTVTNNNDDIQKELQLLLDDMHEICEQQFEETLDKFTRKHILPEVTDENKKDDGRTIGFIYLVTKHCLSHRIDKDDPLFYVMHAIYHAILHGKKACATKPCKKWQVLCSMVYPDNVFLDSNHSLSHYIANCVGKKKVVPPKNQVLLHFSQLYEKRCQHKKDRGDRHCAIPLSKMMTSQLLSSPTTPKEGDVQGKKVLSRRKPTKSNSNPAKKGTKTKHVKDTTPKKSNKTVTKKQVRAVKSVLSSPRRSPRKKTATGNASP